MASELISCRSGKLIVTVAWRRSCVAFPCASLSNRGSGVLQRHTSVPTWHSHAFVLGLYGYFRGLLEIFFCKCSLLGFSAIAAEFEILLKIHMDSPFFHCDASHSENMVAMWLWQASLPQFPSTVGQGGSDFFVLCFCLDNVEEAR